MFAQSCLYFNYQLSKINKIELAVFSMILQIKSRGLNKINDKKYKKLFHVLLLCQINYSITFL